MQYQNCRWYDLYPGLAFVLKIIRLMPLDRQFLIGEKLNQYLTCRTITAMISTQEAISRGNRWYDNIEPLVEGLHRLKTAPHSVKQQSTDFLIRLLEETESSKNCA